MQIDTHQSDSESIAILLYNQGLAQAKCGEFQASLNNLELASTISNSTIDISEIACKICFALGDHDKSESYLHQMESNGVGYLDILKMQLAIDRDRKIRTCSPVSALDSMSNSDLGRGSLLISFCDWLESTVNEICRELRYIAAKHNS